MGKKKTDQTAIMMDYISAHDAAKEIGVQVRTIQKWCKEKKIPAYKAGWEWRIPAFMWDSFKTQMFSQVL